MNERYEVEIDEFTRYRVGITADSYDPSQKEFNHMLYIVAYDICDPKRLRYVAKTCEDYGIRVEYSVFECDLSEELFSSLWKRLTELIDEEEDSILSYRICGSCVREIESMGAVSRPGKVFLYML